MPALQRLSFAKGTAEAQRGRFYETGDSAGRVCRLHFRSRWHTRRHYAAALSRMGPGDAGRWAAGAARRGFVLLAWRRADEARGRIDRVALRTHDRPARGVSP